MLGLGGIWACERGFGGGVGVRGWGIGRFGSLGLDLISFGGEPEFPGHGPVLQGLTRILKGGCVDLGVPGIN